MEMNFTYEVTEDIAVLSGSGTNYQTELNRVSFNGRPPKLDIRKWQYLDGERVKPLKGISLSQDEADTLRKALAG